MNLTKSQKVTVVLSVTWVIVSLLIADGGNKRDFLGTFFSIGFPVWAYWAGVWIWGFGYVRRAIKFALRVLFSKKVKDFVKSAIGLIVVAFVVAATSALIKNYRETPSASRVLKDMERAMPAIASLKVRSPESYQKIEAAITKGIEQKMGVAQIEPEIRQVIFAYAEKRILSVSDDEVVRFVSADLNLAQDLRESAPEKCAALMRGEPTQDILRFVSPASAKTSSEALNHIILAADIPNTFVASPETETQALNAMEPILIKNAALHKVSEDDMDAIFSGKYEPKKSCAFLIDVASDIVALPKNMAALVMRQGAVAEPLPKQEISWEEKKANQEKQNREVATLVGFDIVREDGSGNQMSLESGCQWDYTFKVMYKGKAVLADEDACHMDVISHETLKNEHLVLFQHFAHGVGGDSAQTLVSFDGNTGTVVAKEFLGGTNRNPKKIINTANEVKYVFQSEDGTRSTATYRDKKISWSKEGI